MAKTNIITRAFNRLEYTLRTITSIDNFANAEFKQIVINQASTDGTKECLDSLVQENYYKLQVKHNKSNSGDAGGMKDGWKMLDKDCEYVMQWDNDCEALTNNFLRDLVTMMDDDPKIGCIMLKREGVGNHLVPTEQYVFHDHIVGHLTKATCCMIMRRDILKKINTWYTKDKIGWGFTITQEMKKLGYKVLKCMDLKVMHIDGTGQQHVKYPSYFDKVTQKGTNYTNVEYNKKCEENNK